MNCCDEYGNCRQGRDCPARTEMINQRNARIVSWISDKRLGMLICVVSSVITVSLIAGTYYFFK